MEGYDVSGQTDGRLSHDYRNDGSRELSSESLFGNQEKWIGKILNWKHINCFSVTLLRRVPFIERAQGALAEANLYKIRLTKKEEDNESKEATSTDFIQIFSQTSNSQSESLPDLPNLSYFREYEIECSETWHSSPSQKTKIREKRYANMHRSFPSPEKEKKF